MTEKEFFEKIEKETGLSLEKGEYGFIMGRSTPFTEYSGFQGAGRTEGFLVWKKDGGEKMIKAEGIEKNVENIINFLNGRV